MELLKKLFDIISPIVYGVALAYLLSPILNFFEKKIFRFKGNKKWISGLKRTLSMLCTALVVIILLTAAVSIFIPQIVDSYERLTQSLGGYLRQLDENLDSYFEELFSHNQLLRHVYENIKEALEVDEDHTVFSKFIEKAVNWLTSLISVQNISKLFSVGTSMISVLVDTVLTLIFTVYLLFSKERQLARIRKLCTAFFKESTVREIYRVAYLADDKIGKYLRVQVLDSILVGVVSYFVYMAFGLPYYPMLALISGVTNIIPYFGPFLGGIPNGIFILLAAPEKLLPFILIVLIMQQLDGNVLVPILQSSSMKMDTFWVLVGITVMGGIFGLPGMILGVPTFAVLYILVKEKAEKKLAEKHLATDTEMYIGPFMQKTKKKKRSLKDILTKKETEDYSIESFHVAKEPREEAASKEHRQPSPESTPLPEEASPSVKALKEDDCPPENSQKKELPCTPGTKNKKRENAPRPAKGKRIKKEKK